MSVLVELHPQGYPPSYESVRNKILTTSVWSKQSILAVPESQLGDSALVGADMHGISFSSTSGWRGVLAASIIVITMVPVRVDRCHSLFLCVSK